MSGSVSASGLDLERLALAVATLDPGAVCPELVAPASFDDVVEVGRIDGGCAIIEYVELGGRSVSEVRDELASDPTVFAVGPPAVDLAPAASVVAQAPPPFDGDAFGGTSDWWHLRDMGAAKLWDRDGWTYTDEDGNLRGVEGWSGGTEVVVAVIDDGVDNSHRDLAASVSTAGHACHRNPNGSHGTHVAGIVAAAQGNGVDVAGLAPKATILPIKVHYGADFDDWATKTNPTDEVCYGKVSTLTQAIDLARTQGADVINMSLRWVKEADYGVVRDEEGFWSAAGKFLVGADTVEWAVEVARLQHIVVVAAAGNCGDDRIYENQDRDGDGALDTDASGKLRWYLRANQNDTSGNWKHGWAVDGCTGHNAQQRPASYPGVIAVAATDSEKNRAVFSTANGAVDVAAPGAGILSTVPGGTDYFSGTSMASPLVAAAAAHIIARFPFLTVDQITRALTDTASSAPRRTDAKGYGIIDPVAAINKLDRTYTPDILPPPEPELPSTIPNVGSGVTGDVILIVGESAQGWEGCSSQHCAHLQITLDAPAGVYDVACWSSLDPDEPWYPDPDLGHIGRWRWPSSSLWTEGGCWYGFPGEQVWVTVNGIKSNTITWPSSSDGGAPGEVTGLAYDAVTGRASWDPTPSAASYQANLLILTDETEGGLVYLDIECCSYTVDDPTFTHVAVRAVNNVGVGPWSERMHLGPGYLDVTVGYDFACGLRTNGTVKCWGSYDTGGDGYSVLSEEIDIGTPDGSYSDLSADGYPCRLHALRSDGTIECWIWGERHYLVVPDGDVPEGSDQGYFVVSDGSDVPEGGDVVPEGVFKSVDGKCGIRADGTLACWGDPTVVSDAPQGTFESVSAAGYAACAIRADGTLACWGEPSSPVVSDAPQGTFESVSATGYAACAIRADGALACWGEPSSPVVSDAPQGTFESVSATGYAACAIRADGTLACWGRKGPPGSQGMFTVVDINGNYGIAVSSGGSVSLWGIQYNVVAG